VRWVYPVHRNPNVRGPAEAILGSIANVELHEPFDYPELVGRLRVARLVLTDSGGIQEEAPTFGTPVLVVRETTERPEGIEAGVARLVGLAPERIVSEVERLLTDDEFRAAMTTAVNPYGDGHAGARIAAIVAGAPWDPW
jgi:UDP-N-acetylglucosamine 2-epimerase (non-hydrolysing)